MKLTDGAAEAAARAELRQMVYLVETQDFGGYTTRDAHAVADVLFDAGYRKIGNQAAPEALAQAWDAGRKHGARFPYGGRGLATDDNPYRTAE